MGEYELGLCNMKAFVASPTAPSQDRNEAATRMQLVDRLLFKCLGWSPDDCEPEHHHGGEYADYVFTRSRHLLIVEAKREGHTFEIPVGTQRLQYSLQSLLHNNSDLKAAVEQVASYCPPRGIPFAAVANGHQLVAFVATRTDGIEPLSGRCLVFPSLQFMLDRFLELWNTLSRPAILARTLEHRLLGTELVHLPPKLAATIPTYPGTKHRNAFQTDLQIVSDLVIEDVSRSRELEAEFLARCYCQSGALSQHALVSKEILRARYSELQSGANAGPTASPATTKKGIAPELLANSLTKRPILLLGDVGSGKTMFIRHLMKVAAKEYFERSISIYIDLGSQGVLHADLRELVLDEIARQLRDDHGIDVSDNGFVRGVYNIDLQRFADGIYAPLKTSNLAEFKNKEIEFLASKLKDKAAHLQHCLLHIQRGQKRQVIMFLDNADQRDFPVQQDTFLIAQELAEQWHVLVYVSIRPETFYRSKAKGTLSAYHARAFTIAPPRVDEVLFKRLDFALDITGGKIPISSFAAGTTIELNSLDAVIRVFVRSLQHNDDLVECIDNVSVGNIRQALDFVHRFFGSGHVDTRKMVEIKSYHIPLHEFLRAIIYGDHEHYDPTASPVANVFEPNHLDPKEHFITPMLIGALLGANAAALEDGFVSTAATISHLQAVGFRPDCAEVAIRLTGRRRLIETVARQSHDWEGSLPELIRPTTLGLYHYSRLSRMFTYIDAIAVDLPILLDAFRSRLAVANSLPDRLKRALLVREYLDHQWSAFEALPASTFFDWPRASGELLSDVQFIAHRNGIAEASLRAPGGLASPPRAGS